jgi:hypothetical protein
MATIAAGIRGFEPRKSPIRAANERHSLDEALLERWSISPATKGHASDTGNSWYSDSSKRRLVRFLEHPLHRQCLFGHRGVIYLRLFY